MTDLPPLAPPWTRIPTIHETTDLFTEPTMDALDARYVLGGAPGTLARDTASKTTASLALNATESGVFTVATSFLLLDVTVDRAARVRLYHTTAQRDADVARAVGTYPTDTDPDHGCFLEAIFAAADTFTITAGGLAWLSSGTSVPYNVTNLAATSTVDFGITYLRTE